MKREMTIRLGTTSIYEVVVSNKENFVSDGIMLKLKEIECLRTPVTRIRIIIRSLYNIDNLLDIFNTS